ncbi:hypothetical protein FDP41_013675 [Naegleria fowleri]|uniref:Nbr1 FW domain-containing protein n=1 Tax=Naegleria fowleri TaxID=5763 RepID=A0A6A5C0L7_NAEFO|nr:uncharacterized protein FDP41_013675 [Naegleria fowleri]KAF0980461.1 hypothetical protein FDP41_013675 [Naegleria fowleri]CAG4711791.1 unnamed protein product [Naegleria fowleri]
MQIPSSEEETVIVKVCNINKAEIRRFYFSWGEGTCSTTDSTPLLDALMAKIRHVFGIGISYTTQSEQSSNNFSLIYKYSIPNTIITNSTNNNNVNGQILHVNSDDLLLQLIKHSLETNSDLRLIMDHHYSVVGQNNTTSLNSLSNTATTTTTTSVVSIKPTVPKPLPTIPVHSNNNQATATKTTPPKITTQEFTSKIMEKTNNLSETAREELFEKCLKFIDDYLRRDRSENKNSHDGREPTDAGTPLSCLSSSNSASQVTTRIEEQPSNGNKYGRKLATFVADLSIPDHTKMQPGEHFKKTWKFKNCGHTTLPKNSKLMFLKGKKENPLNAPEFVALNNRENEIRVGQEFQVSVDLQAPSTPGVYSSYFRLADEEGIFFGYKVWVCIDVVLESKH